MSSNNSKYWASKINNKDSLHFINSVNLLTKFSSSNKPYDIYLLNKRDNDLKITLSIHTNNDSYFKEENVDLGKSTLDLWSICPKEKSAADLFRFNTNKTYSRHLISKARPIAVLHNLPEGKYDASKLSTNDLHNSNAFVYPTSQVNLLLAKQSLLRSNNSMFAASSPATTTPINVNFLRKERLYTKLKYSRSPAYDIVSGGSAAILAGFVGFLISEKFGFEMVDSGDFYFLFMYLVFIAFSVRPLLVVVNSGDPLSSIFTLKPIIRFFLTLVYVFLKRFNWFFFK